MKVSMKSMLPVSAGMNPRTHPGAVPLVVEGLQMHQE